MRLKSNRFTGYALKWKMMIVSCSLLSVDAFYVILEDFKLLTTFFNQQMQITTGRYHTLLISNSTVYSCGSSLCGVLGHGPETTQCVAFSRINFPNSVQVAQVSASHNHAAFILQSGEVHNFYFFPCAAPLLFSQFFHNKEYTWSTVA